MLNPCSPTSLSVLQRMRTSPPACVALTEVATGNGAPGVPPTATKPVIAPLSCPLILVVEPTIKQVFGAVALGTVTMAFPAASGTAALTVHGFWVELRSVEGAISPPAASLQSCWLVKTLPWARLATKLSVQAPFASPKVPGSQSLWMWIWDGNLRPSVTVPSPLLVMVLTVGLPVLLSATSGEKSARCADSTT